MRDVVTVAASGDYGKPFGHLDNQDIAQLNVALAFVQARRDRGC